jgi:hypothetical protein
MVQLDNANVPISIGTRARNNRTSIRPGSLLFSVSVVCYKKLSRRIFCTSVSAGCKRDIHAPVARRPAFQPLSDHDQYSLPSVCSLPPETSFNESSTRSVHRCFRVADGNQDTCRLGEGFTRHDFAAV